MESTLGANWQKDYYVWDMCCGVGNLETKHSNHRHLFMSTLDEEDVNIMKAARICVSAERFQYDYLNDDITDEGEIDYGLTGKVPKALRKIIEETKAGKKKILVLINPPYAEATNACNTAKGSERRNKEGVAKTRWGQDRHGGIRQGKERTLFAVRDTSGEGNSRGDNRNVQYAEEIRCEVLDRNANPVGEKLFTTPEQRTAFRTG